VVRTLISSVAGEQQNGGVRPEYLPQSEGNRLLPAVCSLLAEGCVP
jgi:hypothetical protein